MERQFSFLISHRWSSRRSASKVPARLHSKLKIACSNLSLSLLTKVFTMKLVSSDLVISVGSNLFVTESSNGRDQNGDLIFFVFLECCVAATLYFPTYHSYIS
jgi:hypothetical protein